MSYTITYKHPHFDTESSKDVEPLSFGVAGLGAIPNGGSIEVDEDLERNFVVTRGMGIEDALRNDPHITISGNSALSADEMKQLIPVEPTAPVQEVAEDEPEDQPAWLNQEGNE